MNLSKEVWRLLVFTAMMSTLFSFTSIFVNLYFWGHGQSLRDVTLFNLISNLVLFAAYGLGSHLLYVRSIRFVMVSSCVFAAIAFFTLSFYHQSDRYLIIALVGIGVGMTQGMFWAANNSALYFFLKSEDYREYFSVNTMLSQAVAVCVPLLSSGVVLWLSFKASFLLMGVLVLVALWVATRLPKFSVTASLFRGIRYREVFSPPGTRWVLWVMLAIGLLLQFQSFFSMIFIFDITSNELLVALLNVGYSIVLLFALMVYKRTNIHDNIWLVTGIVLMVSGYAMALTHHHNWTIWIVLLMQVGGLFLSASTTRQGYRVAMQGDIVWRTKFGMWQEVPLVVSRSLVLGMALLVHRVGDLPFILLVSLSTAAMLFMPFFQYKSIHEFERIHGKGAGM